MSALRHSERLLGRILKSSVRQLEFPDEAPAYAFEFDPRGTQHCLHGTFCKGNGSSYQKSQRDRDVEWLAHC